MAKLQFAEEILDHLKEDYPQFHGEAYVFLLSAFEGFLEDLGESRHLEGSELAHGVRQLALERFGPLAKVVLEHWGISRTADLGDIVYALIDCGVLVQESGDCREDFCDVFDFEEVFEKNYPWSPGA
ncbi:MAG: Minf_1886 family protein [bacterium]|jgi:uncharacterized repeat protein (TIGR04138 family)